MLMNRSFSSRNESGRQGCDNLELGSSKWSLLLMRRRKKNLGSCCCCSNLLVFFFFFFTLLFLENHPTCALTPDGEALLSFKRGLLETHGAMSNWNESDPDPCGWWGVECHASSRRVSKLNLPYQNLRGPLSPDIGKLDQLRRLGLHRNNLYGPIPQEIGNCTTLKALYLRDNFFTGNIPEELGNLTQLTRLDLSSNGLTGSIPESLGSLSKLTFLNVSTNFLVGEIPTNGILGNCTSNSFMENPGLCGLQVNVPCQSFPPTNPPNGSGVFPPESTPSQTPAAVAGWNAVEGGSSLRKSASYSNGLLISAMSTVAVSLLVAVICCIGWIVYKKRCNNYNQVMHGNGSEANAGSMLVMFHGDLPYTSTEIVKRIENLDDTDIIGSGGFGTVYRLVMDDGCMFAVKAIGKQGTGSERLFARELGILGSFKHRNLVNLRGYCNAPAANLLIYDYVPNGSLEQHLHELEAHQEKLSWTARMRIAQGSARGLAYLHHDCCPRIIHRDIKSSNILLDDCMEPHVADFGLAKLLEDNDSHVTTIVAGTFGYLAPDSSRQGISIAAGGKLKELLAVWCGGTPEYMQSGRATEKGDVYSYGVLLLELLSGKRPTDPFLLKKGLNLVGWATSCIRENQQLDIVDAKCVEGVSQEHVESVLKIAARCINPEPDERPTMQWVVQMLESNTVSPCNSDLSTFYNSPMSDHANNNTHGR